MSVDTSDLLVRLRTMEPELRSAGLDALYLFGSRARGDHDVHSDIDLAFDLTASAEQRFSLLDQAKLLGKLSEELGFDVDFVQRRNLRPRMQTGFDNDVVRVFG